MPAQNYFRGAAPVARSGSAHGFTLVELMVVLLIMGLFIGLASGITQPDERSQLRLESDRLAQLLDLAATQAQLTGKSVAWTTDGTVYRFWRFSTETDWLEIRDDDTLRMRTLPSGMRITALRLENAEYTDHMRLEFISFGSTPAFAIDTSLGANRLTVEGSPIGEVKVVAKGEKVDVGTPAR